MESEFVKVLRIDADRMVGIPIQQERVARGDIPRMYDWTPVTVEGQVFPQYEMDRYTAFQMCFRMPHKFKLYQSSPVSGSAHKPNGAISSEKILPCVAKSVKKIVGTDKENGEDIVETVIEWVEDTKLKSVPKSAEKPAGVDLEAVVEELKKQNAELAKKVDAFSKAIVERDSRIEKLEAALESKKSSTGK